MLAAVAAALKDDEAAEEPPAPAAGAWDGLADHAVAAIKGDAERRLLWRVAEARGQRVSLSELSSNFGLPAAPSLEHDFPEPTPSALSIPPSDPFPCSPRATTATAGTAWRGAMRTPSSGRLRVRARER